jgi:iron uptake system component EfeO
LVLVLTGCSSSSGGDGAGSVGAGGAGGAATSTSDADYKAAVAKSMHDALLSEMDELIAAITELQSSAPVTPGRGWDATKDAAAIDASRKAWIRARTAYEHIEGAIAPIFPDIDFTLDARYDDFMAELAPSGDPTPFDGKGATGLHMLERVLWSDSIPPSVVASEKALPGYVAAAFPATEADSTAFRDQLCAKAIADATTLRKQWAGSSPDVAAAFQGLVSLMNEQREKVNKAAAGAEESRYSQRTLTDLRGNLEGTKKIYALFQPWLTSRTSDDATKDGKKIDAAITGGFDQLSTMYAGIAGEALPLPPATWSAETPSDSDLQTPFGKLYSGVKTAVDPTVDASLGTEMNLAAALLGFPQFKQK